MSTPIIERVRHLVTEGGLTKAGLARAAGLHANTLRDCTEHGWNPTSDTLGKLERFLSSNDDRPVLVPIEEIIDEARNGRMFVLVDEDERPVVRQHWRELQSATKRRRCIPCLAQRSGQIAA